MTRTKRYIKSNQGAISSRQPSFKRRRTVLLGVDDDEEDDISFCTTKKKADAESQESSLPLPKIKKKPTLRLIVSDRSPFADGYGKEGTIASSTIHGVRSIPKLQSRALAVSSGPTRLSSCKEKEYNVAVHDCVTGTLYYTTRDGYIYRLTASDDVAQLAMGDDAALKEGMKLACYPKCKVSVRSNVPLTKAGKNGDTAIVRVATLQELKNWFTSKTGLTPSRVEREGGKPFSAIRMRTRKETLIMHAGYRIDVEYYSAAHDAVQESRVIAMTMDEAIKEFIRLTGNMVTEISTEFPNLFDGARIRVKCTMPIADFRTVQLPTLIMRKPRRPTRLIPSCTGGGHCYRLSENAKCLHSKSMCAENWVVRGMMGGGRHRLVVEVEDGPLHLTVGVVNMDACKPTELDSAMVEMVVDPAGLCTINHYGLDVDDLQRACRLYPAYHRHAGRRNGAHGVIIPATLAPVNGTGGGGLRRWKRMTIDADLEGGVVYFEVDGHSCTESGKPVRLPWLSYAECGLAIRLPEEGTKVAIVG